MNIRPMRREDVSAVARVHIDTWRSTFAGIVPQDYLDQLIYAESEEIWSRISPDVLGAPPGHIYATDIATLLEVAFLDISTWHWQPNEK